MSPTNMESPNDCPVNGKPSYTFTSATTAVRSGTPLSQAVARLLAELTEAECLSLLDGDESFWSGLQSILCDRYNRRPFVHGAIPRLEIPGIRFSDGPRGVVMGESTAFPVSMARGAAFDVELERRVGDAIGKEAKAQGANFFAGVCVNLPRHPAWGRSQETYGEDPVLLGECGLALTQGVQKHVMACVKHFALNSMENARFQVDVQVEDDVLHEIYLPHFRRIVDGGGVAAVMSAYNSVNGEWAGQSKRLLVDILRKEWGFDGFVMSDFIFGLRHAATSVRNGLDIEAPFRQQRERHLPAALESGELHWRDVYGACERILRKQIQFAVQTESSQPGPEVIFCDAHRSLAREVAGRGTVLLKNEEVEGTALLPLDPAISCIAVVGRLARVANTGDKGSSQVFPPRVVTALEGIQCAFPNAQIFLAQEADEAAQLLPRVDLVICVVGYDHQAEGEYVVPALKENPTLQDLLPPPMNPTEQEMLGVIQGNARDQASSAIAVGAGGDRASLRLSTEDVELIRAVSCHPQTVVSVVAGGAVLMEEWRHEVPAILMSWYSGSEGGHALADVLLGRIDASGRLPVSIPTDESHLPHFDRHATAISYDRWYGQHLLDRLGVPAAFPFGYGLSYTTYHVDQLRVVTTGQPPQSPEVEVHFVVRNTGMRVGRYHGQIYGRLGVPDFPSSVLLGFVPVDLAVGQTRTARLTVSLRPLQRYLQGKFVSLRKKALLEVASFAGDPNATCFDSD
ncbi:glycoside hydrolase family 3 protein [Aspergillus undulatus]|uniref:glycoside hydrolase family 3 protein n=1 Tax=Aspergillus undulatus TaxID=1810928 RepID=UPI003CCD0D35